MFQNIRARLQKRKKIKKIKAIIQFANELIYSEKYNLDLESEQEKFIQKLSTTPDEIQLLETYRIVNRITKDQISLDDKAIEDLYEELENLKHELSLSANNSHLHELNIQLQKTYLESEKLKMHVNFLIIQQHINSGKKAFKQNSYSFQGKIYELERTAKGPATAEERSKIKNLTDGIIDMNEQLKKNELEKKELNKEIEDLNKLNDMIKNGGLEEFEQSLLRDMKLVSDLEKLHNENPKGETQKD